MTAFCIIATCLAFGGVAIPVSPAQASAPVLLSGSSWFNGNGVNVCDSSSDPYCGSELHVGGVPANWWQCVELAQRFYKEQGWHTGVFAGVNVATDIYTNATGLGMSVQANGSITSIVPGDMIIHGSNEPYSGGAGHVVIVNSVNGSVINAIEQNTINDDPPATYTLTGGTLTRSGSGTLLGVVHDPDNTSSSGTSNQNVVPNLLYNGGFNTNNAHWSTSGTGNIATYSSTGGTTAYEGSKFGATNGSASGDSIWQEVAVSSSVGDTFCVEARVTTIGASPSASGSLAIWLLGTTAAEASSYSYTNLPGGNNWTEIKTCIRASSAHATIKVQLYPDPNAPTVGVDVVDLHRSTTLNSGFNANTSHWSVNGTANLTTYTSVSGTTPYEGSRFAASNAAQTDDSIWQEIAGATVAGDTICAEARVTTIGGSSGSGGVFAIWLTGGGTTPEVSTYTYTSLSGANVWTEIKTCVTASVAHSNVKVQFYPTPSSPTVGIDVVDVHRSIILNGGFNTNNAYWSAGGSGNIATYSSTSGTTAYEGSKFVATNGSVSGDSIYSDAILTTTVGQMVCAEARVTTIGGSSGASGTLALWLMGGSSTEGSTFNYANVPGGNVWTPIKTCVTASTNHTTVRAQFYPMPGAPTVGIDVLDVH